MTPNEIQTLVDEEIARRRAEEALPPTNGPLDWLRHPLMITLFGFLLTTVIGSFYDGRLKEREETRLEDARKVETARAEEAEAMGDLRAFVQMGYERQVRTDLVRSAIGRGMAEEAVRRKKTYDEIYTRWNVEIYPRLLNLRSLSGQDLVQTPYERAVEEAVLPSFGRSDSCLTIAYDTGFRADFPFPAPNDAIRATGKCGKTESWQGYMKTERDRLRTCLSGILSNMAPQIRARARDVLAPPLTEAEAARWRHRVEAGLAQACHGMAPPAPLTEDTPQ